MNNIVVLIIEPSTAGYDLIPAAKSLGYFLIVMSADADERTIPPSYKTHIDQLIVVDTNDYSSLLGALPQCAMRPPAIMPGFE